MFLDIVGSTAAAAQLGDSRWRVVLAGFRQLVRRELRRHGGREQDTTGDGFFVTFAEPAQALRCAAAITVAVQALGLDVRAGLHTGECEEIDGGLGGIAVHIGARAMALAGAAEVVATSTTKDLVTGSHALFVELGTRELKGVEGTWILYRLRSIDVDLPPPLTADIATSRLATAAGTSDRRPAWPILAAAGVALAAAVAGAAFLLLSHGTARAADLLRLDPATNQIASVVRDGQVGYSLTPGCPCSTNLWAVDGTLWQRTTLHQRTASAPASAIVVRSLTTGRLRRTVPLPASTFGVTVGFGSVWIVLPNAASFTVSGLIERVDELSGRITARIPVPGDLSFGPISAGNGAVWVLDKNATLYRIDPATNRITATYDTGAFETSILVAAAGYEWICECQNHAVLRYDATTHTSRTFHYSEQPWHVIGVDGPDQRSVWLLDEQGETITSLDPSTGKLGQPLGLTGTAYQAAIARGSIWVAAGADVDRISVATDQRTTIPMPKGTNAIGIAVDPRSDTVWIDNSAAHATA